MVGLVYTFNRGQYRWTPLLYYWGAPWVLAWIGGIFAGYAAYQNVPQSSEKLADARTRRTCEESDAHQLRDAERPGRREAPRAFSLVYAGRGSSRPQGVTAGVRRAGGQASSRIVTGPSLTSSTCMCAPNTPVSTGTPSARSAST